MKTPHATPKRRGFGLAITLLAVLIVGMVAASMLRRTAGAGRVLRADERFLQADWLAQSGLERAAARLADDPGFAGETWTIGADELGGRDGASVTIEVAPVTGRDDARRVLVRVDYPTDAPRRVRRSKTAVMTVRATEEEP